MAAQSGTTWTEAEILAHLKQVAKSELSMPSEVVDGIQPDAKILEAMDLDSLAQVVLVSSIERDFGCTFDLEQWQGLETVRDLLQLIARHGSKQPVR